MLWLKTTQARWGSASPFFLAKAKQSTPFLILPVKRHLGTDTRTIILLLNLHFRKLSKRPTAANAELKCSKFKMLLCIPSPATLRMSIFLGKPKKKKIIFQWDIQEVRDQCKYCETNCTFLCNRSIFLLFVFKAVQNCCQNKIYWMPP